MELDDLTKDLRRLLLKHWDKKELDQHLENPEYFFQHLAIPRLDYMRANGEENVPSIRLSRKPTGELLVLLKP